MALTLAFTRVSPTHHRLEVTRSDGSHESALFETRSTLEHDFIHVSLETEAGLTQGFLGLLDAGKTYESLSGKSPEQMATTPEAMTVEIVVGAITNYVRGDADPAKIVATLSEGMAALGRDVPSWLDEDLLRRAKERFRRLRGEWKATPFGKTMIVKFPAS